MAVADALSIVALSRDFIRTQMLEHCLVLGLLLCADLGCNVVTEIIVKV